jgi:hypothetical protein
VQGSVLYGMTKWSCQCFRALSLWTWQSSGILHCVVCRSRLTFQRCLLPLSSGWLPWNFSQLLRNYTAHYPTRLSTLKLTAIRTWNLTIAVFIKRYPLNGSPHEIFFCGLRYWLQSALCKCNICHLLFLSWQTTSHWNVSSFNELQLINDYI